MAGRDDEEKCHHGLRKLYRYNLIYIYYIYSYNTRIICTFVLCTYTFEINVDILVFQQGKELERIFREEGVIDEEDETDEEELGDERSVEPLLQDTGDEIIGHLENKDGQDLGELVIISKQKAKIRTKGRRRKNFSCEICGRGFMHYGRYMVHKTFHKGVRYECTTCSELFNSRTELNEHQTLLNHAGEGIVESLNNEVKHN